MVYSESSQSEVIESSSSSYGTSSSESSSESSSSSYGTSSSLSSATSETSQDYSQSTQTGASPDYVVTGNGSPSPNGDYYYAGEYGGEPCYTDATEAFYIWYESGNVQWWLGSSLGHYGWYSEARTSPTGLYYPAIHSGNPFVT